MILWTMQPRHIWHMIQETGVYRCEPKKMSCYDTIFSTKYDWLVMQMKERIGMPPEGVKYPVWAWHTKNWKHRKPDLRSERWCCGSGNEEYVCIEFEVSDEQVLLSDFDAWSVILCDGLLNSSEKASDQMDAYYDLLPDVEKKTFKNENWQAVFDVSPMENDWICRGKWIQATTWELRKDMIRDVRFFVTGKRKSD